MKNPLKRISIEVLFKQQYKDRIIARRDEIEPSSDPILRLRAYNKAVAEELGLLRAEQPDKYERLQDMVDDLRISSKVEYEGQSPELQEA